MLKPNMPIFKDQEGQKIPAGLPPIIDAHVHIFPHNIFSSIRKWFDANAWHIRYQMTSSRVLEFLLSHGIKHIIALQYAHKPGIARQLNNYMSEKCREFDGRVTGMATVYPRETDACSILQEAFDAGLGGLKLHAHVQCFDINSDYMNLIYECCLLNNKPVVMHAGREPKSTAYSCDPYQLCSAERLEHVLKDFPELKICVPHMGFDEISAYRNLIEKYDNLWLDTTMAIASYFPIEEKISLGDYRSDRVMYGSDFPNIPYEWDRELKALKADNIVIGKLERISYKNAVELFSLDLQPD
jgi:predicted TIM-barrel fold metal-dependent hydrolase